MRDLTQMTQVYTLTVLFESDHSHIVTRRRLATCRPSSWPAMMMRTKQRRRRAMLEIKKVPSVRPFEIECVPTTLERAPARLAARCSRFDHEPSVSQLPPHR